MLKQKDCGGCAHEKVCTQKTKYERVRHDIREVICAYPEDFVIVSVNCVCFTQKREKTEETEGEACATSTTPCDVCRYNPPSSFDGKPCTVCPASAKIVY